MAEETVKVPAKKSGWLSKIPADFLFSPGGIILVFVAMAMETIDLIPLPIIDQIIELPLEILFIIMLVFLAEVPIKSLIIPFLIERVPIINDILPTWVIKMLM